MLPALCTAERGSCLRFMLEGLAQVALPPQGSDTLRKRQEEKPERTEKGMTWELNGKTERKSTSLFCEVMWEKGIKRHWGASALRARPVRNYPGGEDEQNRITAPQ